MTTRSDKVEYALDEKTRSDDEYAAAVGASENVSVGTVTKITKISSTLTVLVSGLALFSDGYNAQVIGYMEPLFSDLYPNTLTSTIKTRLSNAYLIGEIFGMLFFGFLIDRIGRRTGVVFATTFLVLGVILATAAHGETQLGMIY